MGVSTLRAEAQPAGASPVPASTKRPEGRASAPFWRAARNPDQRRAETLIRQGRAQLYPAMGLSMLAGPDAASHRRAAVENAITRFELARKLLPRDPEVLFLSGKALALWERRGAGGRVERRSQQAIARFEELRAVDPSYEAYQVAFELGVLHTLESSPERAAVEYERALDLRISEGSSSTVLSNLAEVTMMAGDLERSVELYERAVTEGTGDERILSRWGLAVALDRLGEHSEANAQAQRAIHDDQRPLGALRQSGVFFVPPYEAYYYEGLGLLALGLEQAGGKAQIERAVSNASRNLSSASTGAVLSIKQVIVSLADEGHAALLPNLREAVDRALGKERSKKGPKPGSADEAAIDTSDTKCVLSLAQSARAFSRFLDAGGNRGPWARDAQAHLSAITGWLNGRSKGESTP